jgi:hypothetical protein
VPQQYRPEETIEAVYYRPTGRGADVDRRRGVGTTREDDDERG